MTIDHAIDKVLRKKRDMFDDIIDQIDFLSDENESEEDSEENE